MRPLLEETAPDLPPIPPAWWEAAGAAEGSPEAHARLAASCPPLHALRLRQPARPAAAAGALRVGAWNVERLKFVEDTAALIAREALDLALLSEVDIGMARSRNRDTLEEVAASLGMGSAYAVEFVELGLGDDREKRWHAGEANALGLHGNAVLSRFPIRRAACIRLDDGGAWFRPGSLRDQRRVGARCAVAVEIAHEGAPLWAVAVHFESEGDAPARAREMERLVAGLGALAGGAPVVIGGDLNTAGMPRDAEAAAALLPAPDSCEPLFAVARRAGYAWETANTPGSTQRTRPDGTPRPPFNKIDWMFVRGLAASDPRVVPAVDDAGGAISDHEVLSVVIRPEPA